MARVFKSGSTPVKVASPAKPLNTNRDAQSISRAPRLKPIKTRIYAKGLTPEGGDPGQFGGSGFGQTGLTGET